MTTVRAERGHRRDIVLRHLGCLVRQAQTQVGKAAAPLFAAQCREIGAGPFRISVVACAMGCPCG